MSIQAVINFVVFCDGPGCDRYVADDYDPELAKHLEEPELPEEWARPGCAPGNWLLTKLKQLCPACADAEGRELLAGDAGTTSSEEPTS